LVYPVPTSGVLNVIAPSPMSKLSVVNTVGQTIAQFGAQPAQTTLDCATIAAGIYTIQVECAEGVLTYPVVVE